MVDFASVDSGDDQPGDPMSQHLLLHDAGRVWDLGPALVDTDADGVPDTLTMTTDAGVTVYTDSDHDGEVDKITSIAADGTYESATRDVAGGPWRPTDSGRLG